MKLGTKWACGDDQELLAGMLVLSSQSRLLGSSPVVWLCDQEPVKSFSEGLTTREGKPKAVVDLPEPVQVDSSSYPRYKKWTV